MHIRVQGLAAVLTMAALVGCGSSSGTSDGGTFTGHAGTGGSSTGSGGKGGSTGSGGVSGGGTFTTSVSSSTKLTGLSSAQATQLCNDVNHYSQTTLAPSTCKLSGILGAFTLLIGNSSATNAQLQAACTSAYNACLSGDGGTVTGTCDPTAIMSSPSTCTATVGDVSTCLNAEGSEVVQIYATIPSCSEVTAANITSTFADAGTGPTDPASCMTLDSMNCEESADSGTN
jgi:hypothetical protein